jgi:hypothetical protein
MQDLGMRAVKDFEPLSIAEKRLVLEYTSGDRITFGEGNVPTEDLDEVTIRAGLIRTLLLDSDPTLNLHEKGLRLRGAWISGILDLQGCNCNHDLTLVRCYVAQTISMVNARMRGLHLIGTVCKGISADNASFSGSIFLRRGFQSEGELSFPGARISGDLQICGARLRGDNRSAIFATSCRVEGSVYLGEYPYDNEETELHSEGAIIFASARISQDFYVKSTAMTPLETGVGMTINQDGGEGSNMVAFSLARAEVGGVFLAKNNQVSRGIVNLSGADIRRMNDEPAGDYATYPIRLDGLTYQDFAQHTDWSVRSRLAWLDRRPEGIDFSAQPYEQLARTYEKIGHREDARRVQMVKERLQRRETMRVARASGTRSWLLPFMWAQDRALRMLIGYGYRPIFALFWGLGLVLILSWYFQKTWDAGDMTPNAAPILVSKDWISATQSHAHNPGEFWSRIGEAGQDYETFSSIAYATDLLIPIINLGQEDAWAPSTSRSPWGQNAWWIRWVAKTIGWVITALGAAAVTGFIRRD